MNKQCSTLYYVLLYMQNIIGTPLPSRLYGYLASPSCCALLELFGLIKLLIQDNENHSLTKMASTATESITSAVHKVIGMIEVHGSHGTDQLAGRRVLLESVVNTVEVRFCVFMGQYYRYCSSYER
jgi:hypothetical protein